MNKIAVFILSIIMILMTACDYGFDYNFYIQNSTDKTILVDYQIHDIHIRKNSQIRCDSSFILPNEKKLVATVSGAGGRTVHKFPIKDVFSKFSVSSDSILSTYDYFNDANWIYTSTTEHALVTSNYLMVVETSHFNE